MKPTKDEIKEFLKSFAERSYARESAAKTELMMDDHTHIQYMGKGYYLPENNSTYTSNDEIVLDYLNENFGS